MNTGEPTRVNRTTGNLSTPDVSLCGSDWTGKTEWNIGEAIGTSDHLPVVIIVNVDTQHLPVYSKTARWRTSGANWVKYREEVSRLLPERNNLNLSARIAKFTSIMIEAAKLNV